MGHSEDELLWKAEDTLRQLRVLSHRRDLKGFFVRPLGKYIAELEKTYNLVRNTKYEVAFIGCIGVGKSTAICRVTNLEVWGEDEDEDEDRFPFPVIEAGAGGVTICEVHINQGPDYGLIFEPETNEKIRKYVQKFAELIKTPIGSVPKENELGISIELIRAIRNMSGLTIKTEKAPDGKPVRKDLAKELAVSYADARSFAFEILTRMNLLKRDRRDIWYSNSVGKEPKLWLRDVYAQVNNGRHPNISIPRRIEIIIKEPVLKNESFSIRLIDTKGIDQTAERADLGIHFDETHTISILCNTFLQAPSVETQSLLRRSIESGTRNLQVKTCILVLPHFNEALTVRDDQGFTAETPSMGYELKQEQIESSLKALGLPVLKIGFFDAWDDSPDELRKFILSRIEDLRESYRDRLNEVIAETARWRQSNKYILPLI